MDGPKADRKTRSICRAGDPRATARPRRRGPVRRMAGLDVSPDLGLARPAGRLPADSRPRTGHGPSQGRSGGAPRGTSRDGPCDPIVPDRRWWWDSTGAGTWNRVPADLRPPAPRHHGPPRGAAEPHHPFAAVRSRACRRSPGHRILRDTDSTLGARWPSRAVEATRAIVAATLTIVEAAGHRTTSGRVEG